MEENKSILNQSVRMYMDIEEQPSPNNDVPSFADEELLCNFQPNIDPFLDEEDDDSYPHRTFWKLPPLSAKEDDDDNGITRSTHSARPIPIPSHLLQPPSAPPQSYHHQSQPYHKSQQPLPIETTTCTVQKQPLEATLVVQDDEQTSHRTDNDQDQDERSKVVRKSLQEETERLRKRIKDMQEKEGEDSKGCCKGERWKFWLLWIILLVAGIVLFNFLLHGKRDWMAKWFGSQDKEVTADAVDAMTFSSTLPPSPSAPLSLAPTCLRPDMAPYFGGGSYRTKSGRLDGRYKVRCKWEYSDQNIVVLQASASCQQEQVVPQCVGYLMPSEYSRQCPNHHQAAAAAAFLTNATNAIKPSGGGSSHPNDVNFVVPGDYRNEILYLGYASSTSSNSDFLERNCSQKLRIV